MRVSKIYTYPIKSLRPDELESAEVTKHGFRYDRRFMLLQVLKNEDGTYQGLKNMQVSKYNEMVFFFTKLHLPSSLTSRDGKIIVTYRPSQDIQRSIEIPLEPDTSSLDEIEVDMYGSATKAYRMEDRYNDWLSDQFNYEVVLAYLGSNYRPILMSTSNPADKFPAKSWFSTITNVASTMTRIGPAEEQTKEITFSDLAPYLVVSEKSMDDVHNRLPDGEKMDITKFRPNIIVAGAGDVWEEDYWAEIKIKDEVSIECIHNCHRCQSINIDYNTGKQGTSEAGKMLSKLQKNRRVDSGAKYSPVFGRYSFLGLGSEGKAISVGDEVVVVKRNDAHTVFDWPGISTT